MKVQLVLAVGVAGILASLPWIGQLAAALSLAFCLAVVSVYAGAKLRRALAPVSVFCALLLALAVAAALAR